MSDDKSARDEPTGLTGRTEPDESADFEPEDAAKSALDRARADARARGLKPGDQKDPRFAPRKRRPFIHPDDQRLSGPGPDDRDPQELGSLVSGMVDSRAWGTPLAIGTVMAKWSEIVGPEVAAHSTPLRVDEGELVVQADSTTWASSLKLLVASMGRRLDEELGPDVVTKITVLGPQAPSWKKGPRSVPGRGPRDTYG